MSSWTIQWRKTCYHGRAVVIRFQVVRWQCVRISTQKLGESGEMPPEDFWKFGGYEIASRSNFEPKPCFTSSHLVAHSMYTFLSSHTCCRGGCYLDSQRCGLPILPKAQEWCWAGSVTNLWISTVISKLNYKLNYKPVNSAVNRFGFPMSCGHRSMQPSSKF